MATHNLSLEAAVPMSSSTDVWPRPGVAGTREYARYRVRPRKAARVWSRATALVAVCGVVALVVMSMIELGRFRHGEVLRKSVIYGASSTLVLGSNVERTDLHSLLRGLGYREVLRTPKSPGEFHRSPGSWEIFFRGWDGGRRVPPQLVRVEVEAGRVTGLLADGKRIRGITLEPEPLGYAGERHGEAFRPVTFDEIPRSLRDALLAAEDHRFSGHLGVDPRGLARAALADLWDGRIVQGGSTITQQLVKNRLLGPERTLWRKIKEIWMALVLERVYSKREIFEAYANELYLGERGGLGIRGVGAAASAYFGKSVGELTLGESALLAGLAKAPNRYSPAVDMESAVIRRSVVLRRMRELGMLTDAAWVAAEQTPVRVTPYHPDPVLAPYFRDYISPEVDRLLHPGEAASYRRIRRPAKSN